MKDMTAIAITTPGGPEVLTPVTLPVPVPKPGEILVKVKAAGVNRPDVLQRQGGYPPPPGAPDTPGLEIAGEVVALGDGVKRYEVGDRVCALVPGGGYAAYAVVHEDNALPVPPGLSFTEAAAIPETFFTVWTNVIDRGRRQAGQRQLIDASADILLYGCDVASSDQGRSFASLLASTTGADAGPWPTWRRWLLTQPRSRAGCSRRSKSSKPCVRRSNCRLTTAWRWRAVCSWPASTARNARA